MALVDNAWYVDDPQYAVTPLGTNSNAAGATLTLASITVPTGALIVVAVNELSGVSGSLSDGGTNTYANASTSPIAFNAAGSKLYLFFVANATALSGATFTYTKGTSGVACSIAAFYVPGIATASAEETGVAVTATGNSASASVTSNAPAQNADLLVGIVGSIANTTAGAATGWNTISTVALANASLGVFTGAVRGGLAPAVLTSAVTSNQWGAGIVAFKYASAPGGYSGVNGWKASTTYVTGNFIRQSDPAKNGVGNERVMVCVASTSGTGTSGATEPSWTVTRGVKTTDNTVTWQEATGIAALNGDLTNTPLWSNASIKGQAITLGQVIQNVAGTLILICTTAGTDAGGVEPSWAAFTNAGATTTSGATWTTLGASFTNWGSPHARLANAFTATWGQAGNAFYLASEHAEMQSSALTLSPPGTIANPNFVYCVNKSNVPPTSSNISTGATFLTTATNSITINGYMYLVASALPGINFLNGTLANNVNFNLGGYLNIKNCTLTQNNTGTGKFLLTGGTGIGNYRTVLDGCNFVFGSNVSQGISTGGANVTPFSLLNCSFTVGTNVPTPLFGSFPSKLLLEGCDLSGFGSGKTIVSANSSAGTAILKDCKLGASVTVAATPTFLQQETYIIRSDNSGTNYRHEKYLYQGTQTVETTIVRTGGASDGTTGISWKIVATANSKWILPFECIPITQWVDTTGSHTVTVYGTTTGGGVPNNDDIWVTVEYLKNAGDPQGGFVTTTKANNLVASATTNNSADASTWGGGGAGNGFKMVTPSFTVNQKGYITVYVNVAKAGATYYVDPLVKVA